LRRYRRQSRWRTRTVIDIGYTTGFFGNGRELDYCSSYDFMIDSATHALSWSASRTGGRFGWRDGFGQFVPAPAPVDWARVACYETPPTPGLVTLTVQIDDELTSGGYTTADDPVATGTRDVDVTPDPNAATWYPDSGAVEDTPIRSGLTAPAANVAVAASASLTCTASAATDSTSELLGDDSRTLALSYRLPWRSG
jgi:hypothetical protein